MLRRTKMSRSDQAQALSRRQPISSEIAAWLSVLHTWFGRIPASWAMRRQTIRSLRQLHICTDRELWDMGLSRADFPAIIKGTYTNAR